jgi:DNA (cytosine-5)-methyltransferase 1
MDNHACESLRTRALFHFLRENGKLDEYEQYLLGKVTRASLVEKYGLVGELENVVNSEISDETYPEILARIKGNLN